MTSNRLDIPVVPSILEMVEMIRNGTTTVSAVVQEHIDRAHVVDEKTNSFISIYDNALEKAKELDSILTSGDDEAKSQLKNKKLLGIPFTVKDLYLVEGTKTTFGSKLMEDFIAPYTATVVQKCLDEGAILIGKCNCDPWGHGSSGENSGFGPTKNPYDLDRVPGGTSSGSAASLAAGVGFFSLGTDTGGSVRQPASFCNLFGLKPTYGHNSRYGIGAYASSFDTPGFFARYSEDIAFLQEIMEGRDENDASTYEIKSDLKKKAPVIGIPKEFYVEGGLEPEIKQAIDNFFSYLKTENYELKDVSIPSTKYSLPTYYILVMSEASSNRSRYDGVRYGKEVSESYEENMKKSRGQYLEDEVKRRVMLGTYCLSAGYKDQFYKKASLVRAKLKKEFNNVFEKVDLMIVPVSPTPAFKLGEKCEDPLKMYLMDIYTVTASIVGIPSLSVPLGFNSEGLPIGIQIMGRKFEEKTITDFLQKINLPK